MTRSTTRTRIVSWDWTLQCGQVRVAMRVGMASPRIVQRNLPCSSPLPRGSGIVTAAVCERTKHTAIARTGRQDLRTMRTGPALHSLIRGDFTCGLHGTKRAHDGGMSHLYLLTIAYMYHVYSCALRQESVFHVVNQKYTQSDFYASHGSINGTPVSRKSRVLRVTNVRRWWSAVAAIILSMAGSVRPARSQVMVSVAHVTIT